jgi:hypothetical protein
MAKVTKKSTGWSNLKNKLIDKYFAEEASLNPAEKTDEKRAHCQ